MRTVKVLGLIAVVIALAGCMRNVKVVNEAHTAGEWTVKTYQVDVDTAKKISKQILKREKFDAIEDNGNHLIAVSSNTYFGVYFYRTPQGTEVKAISKRRYATQIPTTLGETSFHEQFAEAVAKRG